MMVSLDGYFEGENHDLSWHNVDNEFNQFAVEQLREVDTILFGRRTYQLMESYWPTEQRLQDDSVVADIMNDTPKIVFSKTLESVKETDVWKHVRLVKDNIKEEIEKLKQQDGKKIVVLGSSNLCVSLLEEGLLDTVRLMVNPVAIGSGTPLFHGIKKKYSFKLINSRKFANGNVLVDYEV